MSNIQGVRRNSLGQVVFKLRAVVVDFPASEVWNFNVDRNSESKIPNVANPHPTTLYI